MMLVNSCNKLNYFNIDRKTSVSFNGRLGTENCTKYGLKYLTRETGFFRNLQTKEFVVDYIHKNFSHKPIIKILIGGCSSGEEAYTYSMLLDNIKDKLKIKGFDLGKEAIKEANSQRVIMQQPKENNRNKFKYILHAYEGLKDSFLCFDKKEPLSQQEQGLKVLFDNFFEPTDEKVPKEKHSLGFYLTNLWLKLCWGMQLPEFESKICKLKEGKAKNCSFVEGDIMKLGDVTGGNKADVITFANAMYHLISKEVIKGGLRIPKTNAKEIATIIAQNVKQNLNENGIFVLGENECLQTMDTTIVPTALKEAGFEPLNKTDEHEANVWRLSTKE